MILYHLTNPPMHGEDLKPLQVALKHAKLYGGEIDGVYGHGTADASHRAKYRLGYPSSAVDHTAGQQLLNYLNGTDGLPVAFKLRRRARGYGLTQAERQREAIVKYALWGIQHEPQIHYAQVRPMDQLHHMQPLPWWTDCSEFVTTIYCWAGAPDPNGWNYNGAGNTDSMFNNGVFIPVSQAKPGDVVIFGVRPTHHTGVIIDTTVHLDPDLASHGQERGPMRIKLSTEAAWQQRPWVVKRYIND